MVDDTPLLSCMASDGVSLSLASTTFELADVLGAKAAPPYVEVRSCGRPKRPSSVKQATAVRETTCWPSHRRCRQ